jgi:hypothetical protein
VEFPLKEAMLTPATPPPGPAGIRWHPSFDAALAAAGRSGRPVLLFQLLGGLDDEFC